MHACLEEYLGAAETLDQVVGAVLLSLDGSGGILTPRNSAGFRIRRPRCAEKNLA